MSRDDTRRSWRERAGMTECECRVLCVVLSGYSVHGKPMLSTEIQARLQAWGESPNIGKELASVARRGWIRSVGKRGCTNVWEPTDRGYGILGLKRPSRAA
jgi:hypothetical protein